MAPKELVDRAEGLVSSGNIGIAYTYSDPIVMFEYVLETAVLAKRKNLKNIFVSNGYIEADPLDDLLEYIDAFNIDIKAFSQDMYKKHFNADISIIKRNLEAIVKKGRHLEISCLIVPGVNDRIEEAENFFIWLMELSEDIPVHINRYFPCYKATMPPTKMEVLRKSKASLQNI
jgi:pyruvate formate lyase activating enzyme